jgi:FlaA1/EpsC-like NDP-sugar epimerase
MNNIYKNQRILVSGGSGSWGNELASQLLKLQPKEIIIFSRGEISQVAMERKFNNKLLKFVIGDISNKRSVERVFSLGIDYVLQLAALKHVPICENQPIEAINSNINGMINLIDASIKYKIKKFIDVSSDKAVNPSCLYGMTKAIGEKLTIQANCRTKSTEFICIRGGNVLGTNGSLVPYVINQIKANNEVFITDKRMTRFFLTLPQAIGLLFQAAEMGIGGETYVMNMPSFYIKDLVELLVEYYGNNSTVIKEIGAREGEKIHETLISDIELHRTRFVNGNYYVIYPQLKTGRTYFHIWDDPEYSQSVNLPANGLSSNDNLKDKEYLKKLLQKGGWLQ